MSAPAYQPKGGMCMTCAKRERDCSTLPFATMPPISREILGVVIVRCTSHIPRKPA